MTGLSEALATTALKSASGPAANALASWGRKKFDRFLVTYTRTFSENIERSIQKCSNVRNVLYRNQSAATDDKYVSISFRKGQETDISDENLLAAITNHRKIMLCGRGGAGKTMFTKWSVLRIAERFESLQQIPIYVELREIKNTELFTFEQILFKYICTSRSTNTFSQFVEGLSIGLFVFILDAADEINKTDRSEICRKIVDFRHTFPECGILLTSRDFEDVERMDGFERFHTRSLNKPEAVGILEKLDYDEKVKSALIDEINDEKNDKHSFFLENPLMVTIMLLTYDQSKDIPTKRSSFYRRSFEALYERHDASKGIYRRDHHAGLPMDEFEAVFSTFCYGTYTNGRFLIPEESLIPLFTESCKIAEIDEDPSKIAQDAYESVCLLVKEGHDYVFCHRSFQEYFTAVYLRDYRSKDIQEIFKNALSRGQGENVIEFIYEMDKQSFEQNYVLPNLSKIVSSIKRKMRNEKDSFTVAKHFLSRINIHPENMRFTGWSLRNEVESRFMFSLMSVYPDVNLVKAFINIEDRNVPFWDIPLDKAKATNSFSVSKRSKSRIENISLNFTQSAESWYNDSEIYGKVLTLWVNLNKLHDTLDKQYARPTDAIAGRFSAFGRR